MALYRDRILPPIIHRVMRSGTLAHYRARLLARAEGRVLEIGIGSAANLPFYGCGTAHVIGIEPSARLVALARPALARSPVPVSLVEGIAEALPLDGGSIDTVVTTWTLCSVGDANAALGEIRRVLTPTGRLLFVEHGLAPDRGVRWWQDRLTPLWRPLAGGCHLNRPIVRLIEAAGFRIDELTTGYMPGPKPATYLFEGVARIR